MTTIHEVPVEVLVRGNSEFQELVGERLPRAFGKGLTWPLVANGLLARSAAILDSVTALIERGRRADAEVTLRTQYITVTTLCWLAINPDLHVEAWQRGSEAQWAKFDNEARSRDMGVLDAETAAALATERMKPLDQMADDIDAYWPDHIPAFRTKTDGGTGVLSFRGLYTAIFRPASRIAHAELDSLDSLLTVRASEIVVSMKERPKFGRAAFAMPLTALALLVYDHHFDWPGEPRTGTLIAALNFEP
jgi:hypothetical protein